jgi:hypothetical protein
MASTVADATLLLIVPKPKKPDFSGGTRQTLTRR